MQEVTSEFWERTQSRNYLIQPVPVYNLDIIHWITITNIQKDATCMHGMSPQKIVKERKMDSKYNYDLELSVCRSVGTNWLRCSVGVSYIVIIVSFLIAKYHLVSLERQQRTTLTP